MSKLIKNIDDIEGSTYNMIQTCLTPNTALYQKQYINEIMIMHFNVNGCSDIKYTNLRSLLNLANSYCKKNDSNNDDDGICKLSNRDLRSLDFTFNSDEAVIIIRRNCVLMSFDKIRCLVFYDNCILFLPQGVDEQLQKFKNNMNELLKNNINNNSFGI